MTAAGEALPVNPLDATTGDILVAATTLIESSGAALDAFCATGAQLAVVMAPANPPAFLTSLLDFVVNLRNAHTALNQASVGFAAAV